MWIQIGLGVIALIVVLGAIGYLFFKMRQLETRFKVVEAEIRNQFNRLSEDIHKYVEASPIVAPSPPESASQAAGASRWQSLNPFAKSAKPAQSDSAQPEDKQRSSGRLMPGTMFKEHSFWTQLNQGGWGGWILNTLIALTLLSAPFLFSSLVTAYIWAAAAVVLCVMGVHFKSRFFRYLSLFFLVMSVVWYYLAPDWCVAIAIAVAFIFNGVYRMHHHFILSVWEEYCIPLIWVGLAVWGLTFLGSNISLEFTNQDLLPLGLLAVAGLTLCAELANRFWPHSAWHYCTYLLITAAVICLICYPQWFSHPLAGWGLYAWPAVSVVGLLGLWSLEKENSGDYGLLHAVWLLTIVGVASWEWVYRVPELLGEHFNGTWGAIARVSIPTIVILALYTLGRCLEWPCQRNYRGYYWLGAGTLALYLWFWSIMVHLFVPGQSPWGYMPILNPIDIASLIVLVTLAIWVRASQHQIKAGQFRLGWAAFGLSAFLWLNAAGLRYLHHVEGYAFEWQSLTQDTNIMIAYGIGWCVSLALLAGGYWWCRDDV